MRMRPVLAAALTIGFLVSAPVRGAPQSSPSAPVCAGGYTDELTLLSAEARTFDRGPEAVFSYCVRNTATYECLSYAPDGGVRRERRKAVLHGTAFAYMRQGSDTLLLTNDHVAAWPVVTDAQHVVDGVPAGCKQISQALTVVDDELDSYTRDDIAMTRIVTSPQLDVAILKSQAPLHVMPWKVGRSAALRERNVVEVRGFPLGAFRATNVGKVISAIDHDDYGDWDHDDFVVDALLSSGNSGSPVLAVSCATGEYELVGIYHAGYSGGSALNVVVGIDQVREMMTTLKPTAPSRRYQAPVLDSSARVAVEQALGNGKQMFFPFGTAVALVQSAPDGVLLFAVFGKDFPTSAEPVFVVEDLAGTAVGFGQLGRIWFGSARGLKSPDRATLDADTQLQVARVLDALRSDAHSHAAYRRATAPDLSSRQASRQLRSMSKALTRTAATRGALVQAIADVADKQAPQPGETGTSFDAVAYGVSPHSDTPDPILPTATVTHSTP